jgi:hypothetical protein
MAASYVLRVCAAACGLGIVDVLVELSVVELVVEIHHECLVDIAGNLAANLDGSTPSRFFRGSS